MILHLLPFSQIWPYQRIIACKSTPESGKAHPITKSMDENNIQQAAGAEVQERRITTKKGSIREL